MINIEKLCQVIYTLENSGVTFKARKYFPNKRGAIDGTYLCVIVIIVVSCDGTWRVARPFALLRCGHGRGGRPAAPGLRGSSPDSFTHCERAFCSVYHLREQLLIPTGLLVAYASPGFWELSDRACPFLGNFLRASAPDVTRYLFTRPRTFCRLLECFLFMKH